MKHPQTRVMPQHHWLRTSVLGAAAILLTWSAACSSPSTSGPTAAQVIPATVDRSDPIAVTDAFAVAYAGGDTVLACGYANGRALEMLNENSWCAVPANWSQTPRIDSQCTDWDGSVLSYYRVDSEVNGFLVFSVYVQAVDGEFFVSKVGRSSPGEDRRQCSSSAPSSQDTSSTSSS